MDKPQIKCYEASFNLKSYFLLLNKNSNSFLCGQNGFLSCQSDSTIEYVFHSYYHTELKKQKIQ